MSKSFVINNIIDSYSCDKIINELLYTKDKTQDVELFINSPGGDVFTGYALYNALKLYTGRVVITNMGICASMAAFIFLAAKTKRVFKNSVLMFHKASGLVFGNSEELEKKAELLTKIDQLTFENLKSKTNKDDEEIEKLLSNEWWLVGGAEIKENSLADEIIDINNKVELTKISAQLREGGKKHMDEKEKVEQLEKQVKVLEEKITAVQAQNQEDGKARIENMLAMLKMSGIAISDELKNAISEGKTKEQYAFELLEKQANQKTNTPSNAIQAANFQPQIAENGDKLENYFKKLEKELEDKRRK